MNRKKTPQEEIEEFLRDAEEIFGEQDEEDLEDAEELENEQEEENGFN